MTDTKSDDRADQEALKQRQYRVIQETAEVEKQRTKAEEYYIKAVGLYERGEIDEAITFIRSALSLHHTNPKYHYNLAYIYSLKGLYEIAINHYRLFLKYAPPDEPDLVLVKARIQQFDREIKKKFL